MIRILLATPAAIFLAACTGAPAATPAPPAEQYIFAVDVSGSITARERSANEQLLGAFTRTLGFGDRLVVMEAHAQGRRNTPPPLVLDLPTPEFGRPTADDSTNLSDAARFAQPRIKQVLAAPVANGTDLFATLHSVAERVRESPERRTTLVLMSDMLQCAGGVCMEDGAVPDAAWVGSRKAEHALPDLAGTCVVVVGADASTPAGQRVRDFWAAYFQAAGARFRPEKYSYQVTRPHNLSC
jgi:hypothetical protein